MLVPLKGSVYRRIIGEVTLAMEQVLRVEELNASVTTYGNGLQIQFIDGPLRGTKYSFNSNE
jgi:hypothetical protein